MKRTTLFFACVLGLLSLVAQGTESSIASTPPPGDIVQVFHLDFGPGETVQSFDVEQYDGPGRLASVTILVESVVFGDTVQTCYSSNGCGAGCFTTRLFLDATLEADNVGPYDFFDDVVVTNPPLGFGESYVDDFMAAGFQVTHDAPVRPFVGPGESVFFEWTTCSEYEAVVGCAGSIMAGGVDGGVNVTVTYVIDR